MAYQIWLVLQAIYELKDSKGARRLFRNWCAWVHAMRGQTGELPESMDRPAWMAGGHLEGNLAPWVRDLTIAFMEGLNSLF
jgi:hypothetical protein